MSNAFRRISQVFTPPPRRSSERETPVPYVQAKVRPREVRPFVDALLKAEDMATEEARVAQEEILKVARTCGLYLTATEMYSYLSRMRKVDSEGKPTNRSRGFDLAGELYFLRLRQQIDALEDGTRPFGPAIFKDYCNELFDCFFNSSHVRKGVGFPIWLMESLIEKAINAWNFRELYLGLGEQAMKAAHELSSQKAEKDKRNRQRNSRLHRKGMLEEAPQDDPEREIDAELIQYLGEIQLCFASIKQHFLKYPVAAPPKGDDPAVLKAQVEFFYGLLKIADKAGYLGVTALLKEKIGLRLRSTNKEQAETFLNAAAKDYVRLGDYEKRLYLIKLCLQRYHKARDLYAATFSQENSTAVVERITEVRRTYDAHLFTIAQL